MLSNVVLKSLEIEAFRGIRDRILVDLDASTVILTGPNGTGKTSVFDALQWVLLGTLDRLEVMRSRRTVEHIVNSYCLGDRARVTLVLGVGHDEFIMQRRGDYHGSAVEIGSPNEEALYGDAAEEWLQNTIVPYQPDSLETALMTSGLLQQDVMRSILEAKPTERYAHISAVLGLRELERFEAGIQGCSKDATNRRKRAESNVTEARERFEDVAARLETVEQRAVRQAPVDLAHSAIEALLRDQPDGLEIDFPESLDKDNPFVLAQNSRQLREQVAEAHPLAEELQSERAGLEVEPTSQQLESLERAVQESTADRMSVDRAFQRASQDLSAAEEMSQQVARLAATAIPLLSEDCPVCRQSINPNEIETYLRGLADDTSSLLELRQTEVAAQAELAAAREREQQAIALLESANAVVSGWARLRERESALATRWTELHVERHGAFAVGGSIAGLNQLAPEIVRFLDDLADSLERYIDAVGVTLSAGHIDRVRSELRSAQLSLDSLSSRYEQTSLRAARFKRLADASTQARVEVTTKRFAAVEPLVGDIYSRLDPHPSFKVIGFEHSTYYGRGSSTPIVSDVTAGIEADPLIVFSASQANIAALSYFLAMSLGAGKRGLPFVLLDDPLQSMDDVNVLGFADMCRFVRSQRQLIVSTHDRRFANLLHRKLAPREEQDRTLIHRFRSWDRRGPQVETELLRYRDVDAQLCLLSNLS